MNMEMTWSSARTENTTRHFLHLSGGYYILTRTGGKKGYSRRNGADWEVRYTDRYGQHSVRCGLIPGLERAKAYAERLASDSLVSK